MKTTRWVLGALVLGGLFATAGCASSGTYRIPTVAPVVKQSKSEDDDLLKELEGDDTPEPKSSGSKGSGTKSTSEAATEGTKTDSSTKTEEPKAEPAKAEEPKADSTKTEAKGGTPKAETKVAPKPPHKKK